MAAHASTSPELLRLAAQGDAFKATGVYAIFNRIKPAVQHRRGPGAWHDVPKGEGTKDSDILQRRVLYLDFDPERADGVKGISATAEEMRLAFERAERARTMLAQRIPPSAIGEGLSGNGGALFLALVPVPPEGEGEQLIKALLTTMARLLDDDRVTVDTSVSDPKRLCFLPGTTKRKGAHSHERPHRRSAFLGSPAPHRLSLQELRALVMDLRGLLAPEARAEVDKILAPPAPKGAPTPKPAPSTSNTGSAPSSTRSSSSTDAFRLANEIPVASVLFLLGLLDGSQPTCPGCNESDGSSVAIVGNGLKCSHNRCSAKGYREGFRTVVDLVMERETTDEAGALDWLREHFPEAGIPERKKSAKTRAKAAPRQAPADAPHDHQEQAAGPTEDAQEIRISADLHGNIDAASRALTNVQTIYTRGLSLAQIVDTVDPERADRQGLPVLRTLPRATLREQLAHSTRWLRFDPRANKGGGEWKAALPTDAIVQGVEARGHWPELRTILGLAHTPFLRRDGSVCIEPGYDVQSGFVLVCREHFPTIPEAPTQEDARAALASLLDLFCDFPFINEAARHVPVAALLTMLALPALGGANTPAFLFEANTPGTGKGLVIDVVTILATGREAPKTPWSHDEEMTKVLGAAALEGASVLAFDNISQEIPFGGSAIELVLTCSGLYKPRILGRSESPTLPWRAVVLGTGNNVTIKGDTRRRVLLCTQQTALEHPEQRDDFKYPELKAEARARRGAIVAAALTLLRAHAIAGRPAAGVRRMGSFEEWAKAIASAIAWAGGPDVTLAMPRTDTSDDPILSALGVLLETWHLFVPAGLGLRLGALADKLYPATPARRYDEPPAETSDDGLGHVREALELLAPARGGGRVRFDVRRLGYVLRAHRGRNIGGRAFKEGTVNHGAKTWAVGDPHTDRPEGQRGGSGGSGGSSTSDAGAPRTHAPAHTHDRTHERTHAGSASDGPSASPTSPTSPTEVRDASTPPPASGVEKTPPANDPLDDDDVIDCGPDDAEGAE